MDRVGRLVGNRLWQVVLAAAVVLAAVTAAVPGARMPVISGAGVAAPALAALGVLRNRPRPAGTWQLAVGVLAMSGAATVVTAVQGRVTPLAVACYVVSLAFAAGVVATLARDLGRNLAGTRPGLLDGLVLACVAVVLALQVGHLLTVPDPTGTARRMVVPTLELVLCASVVRVVLLHRGRLAGSNLALAAAVAGVVSDLLDRLAGRVLPEPGDPAQVPGLLFLLLFAAAALHPSSAVTARTTRARARTASAAFLGLLPFTAVPLALWALARWTGTPTLPTPVYLVTGTVIAGLCLYRGVRALAYSEHLADHDALTGLLNRRGLARVDRDEAPPGGWSLLLVDVDQFKQVNDTHGHDVGDELLLAVRDRLVAAGGPGAVVARLGGDEFVLLADPGDAGEVARRALRALREPVRVGPLVLRVSGSIGTTDPDPEADLATRITRADIAMYVAKSGGRDAVAAYDPSMRAEVATRFQLTGDVRLLLGGTAPDVGVLEVWYQPVVELATGRPVGAEALVRWRHPARGLLVPAGFLRLVNAAGLDARLDEVVVGEVVAQLAAWRAGGRRALPVAVNLTRASLVDPGLADRVLGALAAAGVPAQLLRVEVTEHEQLPDDGVVAAGLRALADAGVEVLLDDYGTGFTSLDNLARFPVAALKLDPRVVAGTDAGSTGTAVLAGVVAMAETVGVRVVAEGVETPAQRARLCGLGVRFGQGFLFAPPTPADTFGDAVLGPAADGAVPAASRTITARSAT